MVYSLGKYKELRRPWSANCACVCNNGDDHVATYFRPSARNYISVPVFRAIWNAAIEMKWLFPKGSLSESPPPLSDCGTRLIHVWSATHAEESRDSLLSLEPLLSCDLQFETPWFEWKPSPLAANNFGLNLNREQTSLPVIRQPLLLRTNCPLERA